MGFFSSILGGGGAGAVLGGIAGSIIPGVGTALGAAIGGGLGASMGAQYEGAEQASDAQSYAAKSAAQAQVYAANKAYEAQMAGIKSTEEMTAPWRKAGAQALGTLQQKMAVGSGKFETSPGYQFRLSEGEGAINRMAAARGGLLSGATGKALTRYGQDYATQDYDNFLTRYYQSLSPYQSLAGLGQTSAAGTAANTAQGYGNLANIQTQSGAATAAGYLGQGQAQAANYLTQGSIFSNTLNQGINAYALWKLAG